MKKHHKTDKTTFFFGHFIEKVLLYSLLLPLFPIFKSTVASQQKHFHRNCSKQNRNASLENNTTIANYVLKINHHLYFFIKRFLNGQFTRLIYIVQKGKFSYFIELTQILLPFLLYCNY